jgi:hypothetical protein
MHAPFLPTLDVNLLKNNKNLWGDLRLKPTLRVVSGPRVDVPLRARRAT